MSPIRRWYGYAIVAELVFAVLASRAMAAAPPERSHPALDAKTDERLAQPVPLSARGETLAAALRALTQQTGVRLEAARELADLKVMLRSRDLPLGRSLAEIAELLDLTWTRRGAAPQYHYECARSQEATLRAQAALAQARTTNRAAIEAQMMRIAEAFRKGDPSSLATTDPEVAAALNDPNQEGRARVALQYLSMIPPQVVQSLLASGRITTSLDQMPPQAQEYVRRQTEASLPLALGNIRGPDGNSVGYDQFLKSASYSLGMSGLDYGGNTFFAEARAGGVSFRITVDLGIPPAAPGGAQPAAAVGGAAAGSATNGTRRPLPHTAATLDGGKAMSVREITDWLADNTPLAIVSDYYAARYERRHIPIPAGATAEAALAALERYGALEATVAPDDKVLRLRSRTWPLDDLMEPPPAAVEALDRALKANGVLTLPEYLLAAQLTDAQNTGLARMDEGKYGAMAHVLDGSRPVVKGALRLMGTLSLAQRAAATSPAGLSLAQLIPAQRSAFAEALTRWQPDLKPEEIGAAMFRIRLPQPPAAPGLAAGAGAPATENYAFSIELPGPRTVSAAVTVGRRQ